MSEFSGFLRESVALSARRQLRDLEQKADPREVVKIGALHADRYYSHALAISVLPGWVVMDFFDTDRDDTLRPQTFAATREEWEKLYAAARGQAPAFVLGRLRTVTANPGCLDTEDAYGSHFSVDLDDGFDALYQKALKELQKTPPQTRAQELQTALGRLAGGAWQRSHPVVTAIQDRFETSKESAQALAPHLHSDNCAVLLFVCALLHTELKEKDPDLLIQPLLKVVETAKSPSEREAAEGHLSAFPTLPTPALERLAKQVPLRGGDPYDTGSLLRPLLVAKDRAAPAVAPLAKVFPALLERAKASHRIEYAVVVDQVLKVFAAVPGEWATSRGAVEYAIQANWSSAQECKAALLAGMTIPWSQGLVVPGKPPGLSPPATPTGPRPRQAYVPLPEPPKGKPEILKHGIALVLGVLVLGLIYATLTTDPALQRRERSKPSPKRPAKSLPAPAVAGGYQLGGAVLVAKQSTPPNFSFQTQGQPVEEVKERWARYSTPNGPVVVSHFTSFSGRSNRFTVAQSEALELDGKVVLRAGQPLKAWKEHQKAAEAAGINVQRAVGRQKTSILGFTQGLVEDSSDWSPHTSAPKGSAKLLEVMSDRKSKEPDWKAALATYPDWKGLRLSDGDPLVHRLVADRSTRRDLQEKKARYLIENGCDLTLLDCQGRSLLHVIDDLDLIQLLLKKGMKVDQADIYARTALFGASEKKLELLLAAKANPNHRDSGGRTPLMLASSGDAVFALLQAGALADAKDELGRNALFYQRGLEPLMILLEAGADPDAHDSEGKSVEQFKNEQDRKTYRLARSKAL